MIVIGHDATPGSASLLVIHSCWSQRFVAPPQASVEGVADISRENEMIFLPGRCRQLQALARGASDAPITFF
jgi:hypothetical protein